MAFPPEERWRDIKPFNGKSTRFLAGILLLISVGMTNCSELRPEFEPHTWHYQPFSDMPPSWESDFGRPGPEYGGVDMFEDTW